MSEKIIYNLEFALKKIGQISEICKNSGVTEALEDKVLLKPALMMHIDIIYQQIAKLEQANEYEILSKFDKEALQSLKCFRHHNYHDTEENEIIKNIGSRQLKL